MPLGSLTDRLTHRLTHRPTCFAVSRRVASLRFADLLANNLTSSRTRPQQSWRLLAMDNDYLYVGVWKGKRVRGS